MITAAHVRYLALPTGMKSFVLPNGHRTPTDLAALLIRVTDSDGATGQSMLWAQREEQLPVMEAALRYLAPAVVGLRAEGPEDLEAAMQQAGVFLGESGAMAFGLSGLEMAAQDLRCRRAGLSLSRLLGQKHDHIRAYQTGLMIPLSVPELIEEAAQIYARGFRAIKMIVGRPSLDDDVARIQAVKESLPGDARLMVDALQRWTVDEARRALKRFAELDLVWVEDPIPYRQIDGYRELVQDSDVPIATGEAHFEKGSFLGLLDAGVPYVIGELERCRGISGWLETAELVQERGATMLPHTYPHVSAQVMATLPQPHGWWEFVPWFDSIDEETFELHDGNVIVPQRPGSGLDPSPDAIERHSRSPWLSLAG